MVNAYDRLDFVKAPLTPVGYVGKGTRAVLAGAAKVVNGTEEFDKVILKPGSAILGALDYVGVSFAGMGNLKKSLDSASKFTAFTNVFPRLAEFVPGETGKSFYETENPTATIKIGDQKIDFKRTSRGALAVGHFLGSAKWIAEILGYGKYVGHFVKTAAGTVIPSVALVSDGAVGLSALSNMIGTSLSAYRLDKVENVAETQKLIKIAGKDEIITIKGMSKVRAEKWKARQLTSKALEDNDQSKIAELRNQYVNARVELGAEKNVAEEKWDQVIVNKTIFDNVEQRAAVRTLADRHVKYYEAKATKVCNERVKSFVAIMYEIFKVAIITIAIVAAVFTVLALTPVVPFAPFFVVVGLLCSGFGAAKVFVDYKATNHGNRFKQIEKSFKKTPVDLVNHHKNAYRAYLAQKEVALPGAAA